LFPFSFVPLLCFTSFSNFFLSHLFLPTDNASHCGFKGRPIKVATYLARSPWKRFAEFSNKR
jgi:hypothetical protein